jgi:hypothetical protein
MKFQERCTACHVALDFRLKSWLCMFQLVQNAVLASQCQLYQNCGRDERYVFVFYQRMNDQNVDHIINMECFLKLGMSTIQICAVFSEVYGTEIRRNKFSSGINCSEGSRVR